MFKSISKKKIIYFILTICILITTLLEWKIHRRFIFLWDDLWYSTNLVTGEKLSSISDVLSGQYWHYFNWGGRTVNHSLLQLYYLLRPESFASQNPLLCIDYTQRTHLCQVCVLCSSSSKIWDFFPDLSNLGTWGICGSYPGEFVVHA